MNRKRKERILKLVQSVERKYTEKEGANQEEQTTPCLEALTQVVLLLDGEKDEAYVEGMQLALLCVQQLNKGADTGIASLAGRLSQWCEKNIPEQYEVLFLPYKAEMWDCLDTIWRTASKDKRFHVTVMPVAYYTFDEKQVSIEVRDEKNRFPAYVPVTDFHEYDLAEERPDVIIVHNPYDKNNNITMVDMAYHSDNLRKYTDRLVYVPYYVIPEFLHPQFTISPVLKNAWKSFVQSEAVKQNYLAYTDLDPESLVALGTPKFDYVLREMNNSNHPIPAAWAEIIGNKKVFLYNITIGTFLRYTREVIVNIQKVFEYFLANPDVILIWRPHPLLYDTILNMCPEQKDMYGRMVRLAELSPNIIYDQLPDPVTGLMAADAYFGDFDSSLFLTFGITGKPVYLLEPGISSLYEVKDIPLNFDHPVIWNNKFFFSALNFNGFFSIDLEENKTEFICHFPDESIGLTNMHCGCYLFGGDIWFVPCNGHKVFCYTILSGRMQSFPIPVTFESFCEKNFDFAFVYNDYLLMVPVYGNGIVRLNTKSGEMVCLRDWPMKVSQVKNASVVKNLFDGGVVADHKLWLISNHAKQLLEVDLFNYTMDSHDLDDEYGGIAFDGESLWLGKFNGAALVKRTGEFQEEIFSLDDFTGGDQYYANLHFDGTNFWMIPGKYKRLLQIGAQNSVVEFQFGILGLELWDRGGEGRRKPLFKWVVQDKDMLWFPPRNAKIMMGFDLKEKKAYQSEITVTAAWVHENINLVYGGAPSENPICRHISQSVHTAFHKFVQDVKNGRDAWGEERQRDFRNCVANGDGTSGEKIWAYIVDYVVQGRI